MAADRLVGLVKDRPGRQQGFVRAEQLLHHEQIAVAQSIAFSGCIWVLVRKSIEPVVAGILGDAVLVDG